MASVESDNESLMSTTNRNLEVGPVMGYCQGFHPVENNDKVTVLTLQLPPVQVDAEEAEKKKPLMKEAFFHICLDVSGSMCGSPIYCAKIAMQRLVKHLIDTCAVPADRITIYLFSNSCQVRRLGQPNDQAWMDAITANGGKDTKTRRNLLFEGEETKRKKKNSAGNLGATRGET